MPTDRYTLSDLSERTSCSPRTIRSWIKGELLPRPEGMGPGAHYTDEHLNRILFLRRVAGARIPKEEMRALLSTLSEDTIRRVAMGEEEVHLVGGGEDQLFSVSEDSSPYPAPESSLPPSKLRTFAKGKPRIPRRRSSAKRPEDRWTTIDITDDVELRIRGDDPERVAWLARMARQLREWIDGQG